jgi:peptidoglycan/xylan/chitin deacetylase (PgdA/CDA1 family)
MMHRAAGLVARGQVVAKRRLRRVGRGLVRRFKPAAQRTVILMYHRVIDVPTDPQLLAVRPRCFAEQLEVLRRLAQPMPLSDLVAALASGTLPERAVVVTFDDGYADNLHNALPLLERFEVPATVYVTSGHVGVAHEFWWDDLERLLLVPGELPQQLRLELDGVERTWHLDGAATYSADDARRHRAWHIEQPHDPSPRHSLYRSLYDLVHAMDPGRRGSLLRHVSEWAGADGTGRPAYRSLSRDELARLGRNPLIEIGAHSVSHPALARLARGAQHVEIEHCKGSLEDVVQHPVTSFAYPHGSFDADTVALVRQVGFTSACTSEPAAVGPTADTLRLPRYVVRDWDKAMFTEHLRDWLQV